MNNQHSEPLDSSTKGQWAMTSSSGPPAPPGTAADVAVENSRPGQRPPALQMPPKRPSLLRGRDKVCDTGNVTKSTQSQINPFFLGGVTWTKGVYFLNTLLSSLKSWYWKCSSTGWDIYWAPNACQVLYMQRTRAGSKIHVVPASTQHWDALNKSLKLTAKNTEQTTHLKCLYCTEPQTKWNPASFFFPSPLIWLFSSQD